MDEKERDNVAVFDTLFTNNQIQIMKILLPCFDRPMQKYLAVYIKYQELQYTLSYFRNHPYHICSSSEDPKAQLRRVLPALLPYCNDSQKQTVRQIEQIFSTLETYQEMMDMMDLMKEMGLNEQNGNNESAEGDADSSASNMDMLLSLLSPEQQEIFDLIKGGMKHE